MLTQTKTTLKTMSGCFIPLAALLVLAVLVVALGPVVAAVVCVCFVLLCMVTNAGS